MTTLHIFNDKDECHYCGAFKGQSKTGCDVELHNDSPLHGGNLTQAEQLLGITQEEKREFIDRFAPYADHGHLYERYQEWKDLVERRLQSDEFVEAMATVYDERLSNLEELSEETLVRISNLEEMRKTKAPGRFVLVTHNHENERHLSLFDTLTEVCQGASAKLCDFWLPAYLADLDRGTIYTDFALAAGICLDEPGLISKMEAEDA